MRSRFSCVLALCCCGLLAAPPVVRAESVFAESIEWVVADSDRVVVGKVVKVEDKEGFEVTTVAVTRTFKGAPARRVKFVLRNYNGPCAKGWLKDALVRGDPGLDVVEAVVALGDEEEEPDGQDLAGTERASPVRRGREVAVQGGRQVQALQGGPQDGQVGNDFDAQQAGFGGVHPARLPTSLFLENHPERKRTAGWVGKKP